MELYKRLRIDESQIGKRSGSWTQIGASFSVRPGSALARTRMAVCECDCGSVSLILLENLKGSKSTGCCKCRAQKVKVKKTRHGLSRTRTHNIWWGMIVRCTNPKVACWKDYGGRGITVCDRWRNSFEAFLEDMGHPPDGHEIERDDVNGNYEPGNCRWATLIEQSRNKRNSRILNYRGRKLKYHELSELCGISTKLLRGRLCKGWSVERAAETPRITTYLAAAAKSNQA